MAGKQVSPALNLGDFEIALLNYTQQLLTAPSEQAVFETAAKMAAAMFTADFAAVFLLNNESDPSDALSLRAVVGCSAEEIGKQRAGHGQTPISTVVMNGTPLVINQTDRKQPTADFQMPSQLAALKVNSLAVAPLIFQGFAIGVLAVFDQTDNKFQLADGERLLLLAGQAALALEKVRLFENVRYQARQQQALLNVSASLSQATTENELYWLLVDQLHAELNYNSVTVFLYEDLTHDRVLVAGSGQGAAHIGARLNPGVGLTEIAFLEKRVVFTPDVRQHPRYHNPVGFEPGAEIDVPLRVNDTVIGILSVEDWTPNRLTDMDVGILTAAAQQASAAVARIRALESERRQFAQFSALRATLKDISAELELSRVLRSLLERLIDLLNGETAAVGLYDAEKDELQVVDSIGVPNENVIGGPAIKYGAMQYAATAREPIIINDYQAWTQREYGQTYYPWTAVMVAPMLYAGDFLGVVAVGTRDADRLFNDNDLTALVLLAQQTAVAVRNAHLYAAVSARAYEAETLQQASAAMPLTLEQAEVVQRVLDELRRVVPYHSASLQLYRDNYAEIIGGQGDGDWHTMMGKRFPVPGPNPNTYVIQQGQPLIQTKEQLQEYPAFRTEDTVARIRSWLGVPLIVGSEVIGMMSIDRHDDDAFTAEHLRLVSVFVDQVAVAVKNVQLFNAVQQHARELQQLYHAAQELGQTLEPEEVRQRLVTQMSLALNTPLGFLLVLAPDNNTLQVVASYPPEKINELAITALTVADYPLLTTVLNNGEQKTFIITNPELTTFEREAFERMGVQSLLVVPLRIQGQIVGVVLLAETQFLRVFSSDEQRLIQALMQVSIGALENAELFKTTQHQRAISTGLLEIIRTASASLNLRQVLRQITRRTAIICDVERCSVLLLDETGHEFVPVMAQYADGRTNRAAWRAFSQTRSAPKSDFPVLVEALETRQAILAYTQERPAVNELPRTWVEEFGITQYLVVPLLNGDEPLGVMMLDYTTPERVFSSEQVALAETIAAQVVSSIANARLYEAARQDAESRAVLQSVSQEISASLDVQSVCEAAYQAVQRLVPCEVFYVSTINRALNSLEIVYLIDQGEYLSAPPMPLDNSLSGRVVTTSEPLRVNYRGELEGRPYISFGEKQAVQSLIISPMWLKGEVFGVLSVQAYKPFAYTDQNVQLLSTLGNQLAVALENALLFEAMQQRNRELDTLNVIAATVTREIDLPRLYDMLLNAVRDLLQVEHLGVILQQPDGTLTLMAGEDMPPAFARLLRLNLNSSTDYWDWLKTQDVVVNQQIDHEESLGTWRKMLMRVDVHALATVALRVKGELIGALHMANHSPNSLTTITPTLLRTLGDHLTTAIANARMYSAEKQRNAELAALYQATRTLLETLTLDELLHRIVDTGLKALPLAERGVLLLFKPDSPRLGPISQVVQGYSRTSDPVRVLQPYAKQAITLGNTILLPANQRKEPQQRWQRALITTPLKTDGGLVGALVLEAKPGQQFGEMEQRLLEAFANTAVAALRNSELHEEVWRLARTDQLTGVFNRHYFFELGQDTLRSARQLGYPLVAMLIDVDRFKRINDTLGHMVGDQVLVAIAQTCKSSLRDIDILARYGGEEFVALLPNLTLAQARERAEALCDHIENLNFPTPDNSPLKLSVSVGLARADAAAPLELLLDQADQAMYAAKHAGGGQVAIA